MDTSDLLIGLIGPTDPEYDDARDTLAADRRTVVVIVFAPKDPEPKKFRFLLSQTVGDAAKVAADAFKYTAGTPSFQTEGGTVLDRNLTLEAAGIRNREELELVDAGGGV